jgi:sugar (pentulose or hexulose) kinase
MDRILWARAGTDALLGIDVGTTFCKAVLVTLDGRERATGRTATPWRRNGGRAEAYPVALKAAALTAVAEARRRAPELHVIAVGVTSMAETGVLVDARGGAVGPAIAWHDSRGAQQADELRAFLGDQQFAAIAGLAISPLCSLVKYRWLIASDPQCRRGLRWFSVAEWLVREFGTEEFAELSLASRTGFLDVRRNTWSEAILDWAGVPDGFLPPLQPAGAHAGHVVRDVPGATGATLTIAGHDHLCAVVGAGALEDGDVINSWGTAEALIASRATPPSAVELTRAVACQLTIGRHVLPGRFAVVAGFLSGLALGRFLALLGIDPADRSRLDEAAAASEPGACGISVEGVSSEDPIVKGIGLQSSPALLWRAVLEAICREGADLLENVERFSAPRRRLIVTGGWARSDALTTIKEAIAGPFVRPIVNEASARGAALLAGYAAGVYRTFDELPRPVFESRPPVSRIEAIR